MHFWLCLWRTLAMAALGHSGRWPRRTEIWPATSDGRQSPAERTAVGSGGIQAGDRASRPRLWCWKVVEVGLDRTGDGDAGAAPCSTLLLQSTDGEDEDADDVRWDWVSRRCSSAIFDCTYARTLHATNAAPCTSINQLISWSTQRRRSKCSDNRANI